MVGGDVSCALSGVQRVSSTPEGFALPGAWQS